MKTDEKNCFIEQLDENLSTEGKRIAVDDNLFVKGKKVTGSSKMLANFIAPFDATVVERIREAGMVVAGKTNISEFGAGGSTESSHFGITPNPYYPEAAGCGAATAIAEGMVSCALGSDSDGSTHRLAVQAGISFLKPTYGTVSRYGMIAGASSMEQIGVYAKSVKEGFQVLESISGFDAKDGTSYPTEKYQFKVSQDDCGGLKIGIPENCVKEGDGDTLKYFEEKLASLGADIAYFNLSYADMIENVHLIISSAEFCNNISRFDGVKYGYRTKNYDNIDSLIMNSRTEAFHINTKKKAMLGSYVLSEGMYEKYYDKALRIRRLIKEEVDKVFVDFDCIMIPVGEDGRFASLGNVTGNPVLSVPCDRKRNGLYTGVQLLAKEFEENVLLQIGDAL